VTGTRGRRSKQLLDGLKGKGTKKLKEEALDRTLYRTCFGRSHGSVVKADYEMNVT